MNVLDLFKPRDIHKGVAEYLSHPDAVLLDVRTPAEYREGHIPNSKNIPLQVIDKAEHIADHKDTPLFVYCYSGARSNQAVAALRRMGHTNVTNIGGISAWTGKVAR